MNWRRTANELPKDGEVVWVLEYHSKEKGALSANIWAGEVHYYTDGDVVVGNNDDHGMGWHNVTLRYEDGLPPEVIAWLPADELLLPSWVAVC